VSRPQARARIDAMSEGFVDVIKHEVAEEKAGALGRAGRRLEQALDLFRDYERSGEPHAPGKRERLLWELAERVHALIVQREACGLRDSRQVLKHFAIPREALARVGARRPQSS
jgi:hypothetical protein